MVPGGAGTRAALGSDSPVLRAHSLGGLWGLVFCPASASFGLFPLQAEPASAGGQTGFLPAAPGLTRRLLLSYSRGRVTKASQRASGRISTADPRHCKSRFSGRESHLLDSCVLLPREQGRVISRCRRGLTWHRCKDAVKGALHRRPRAMEILLGGQES